jgi:hypothetical protein
MNLLSVEMQIIRWMVADHSAGSSRLLTQLSHLQVVKRQSTGKGFFLLFKPISEQLRCDEIKNVVSAVISTNLPYPRDVVGFSLFINEGAIGSFEGYTFGSDPWPSAPMENWLALEELAVTGQNTR